MSLTCRPSFARRARILGATWIFDFNNCPGAKHFRDEAAMETEIISCPKNTFAMFQGRLDTSQAYWLFKWAMHLIVKCKWFMMILDISHGASKIPSRMWILARTLAGFEDPKSLGPNILHSVNTRNLSNQCGVIQIYCIYYIYRVIFWKQIDKESQLGSLHTFRVSILSSFQGPFVVPKNPPKSPEKKWPFSSPDAFALHRHPKNRSVLQWLWWAICWVISKILGGEKSMVKYCYVHG